MPQLKFHFVNNLAFIFYFAQFQNILKYLCVTGLKILFSENNGIVFQGKKDSIIEKTLAKNNVDFIKIGTVTDTESLQIKHIDQNLGFSIPEMRKVWFE